MSIYKNKINQKKFLGILILCTLIFTLTFQMNPGFIRKDISNNLRTSAGYDPAGTIALWSGPLNTIPAGWKLCDGTTGTINTTGLFVYSTASAESPGATGGSTSHNHSYATVPLHDHGVTSTTSTPHSHNIAKPTANRNVWIIPIVGPALRTVTINTGADSALHNHGGYSTYTGGTDLYMSEEENFIPPYYEMAFIEKETNDPNIPIGLIVMWAGNIDSIPAGWELCNGSNGTPDLREKFIRGAPLGEDPGTLGGHLTHNHTYTEIPTHRHSIATDGASHSHGNVPSTVAATITLLNPNVYSSAAGFTDWEDVPHIHDIPAVGVENCTTQDADNLPPYFKVAFIMNTVVSNELPLGAISMWGDSIANIPSGWNQCNGTNNTPDMLNRFLRGVATGEQPGIVGGTVVHRHNYTEVPLHTHTVLNDNMNHRHTMNVAGAPFPAPPLFPNPTGDTYNGGATVTTTGSSSPSHNHDVLPFGDSTPYTENATSLPPYVKLIYIQKGLSLSNPSPQDGATDISYNPALNVEVNDLEGDDLTVSFYDASDDSLMDTDVVFGGTGTASTTWLGLSSGTSYSWYVISDDGLCVHQSDTWSFTTNYGPNDPTNPTPNDGATDISYSPIISVDVSDDDGDDLTVSFYDDSDDSIIDTDVVLGGTGTASVTWSGLSSDTSYSWYVKIDDGLNITQSATWSFTTNYVPNDPTNPTPNDGATDISYSPIISVDVSDDDGDDLTVSFYDDSDDSIIDTDVVLGGTGTASVTWSGLSSDTSYSWYVKIDDGLNITQSATWSFTTNYVPNDPTNPTPNDGATDISYSPIISVDVSDDDGDDLTVSFYDDSDDSLIDTEIVLGGSGTASVTWTGLSSETSYSWYAISDDGLSVHQSATWSFTTDIFELNRPPNAPTNPTPNDGATGVGDDPTLSMDVSDDDGDTLTVTFYNAMDNSVLGSDTVTGGIGTASITWSGVSGEMICNWYVIADDGKSATQSSTCTFTTYDPSTPPPGIPLPGLIPFGLIVIGTTGILSVITHLRRKRLKRKYFN